jgi:hypothetical protein
MAAMSTCGHTFRYFFYVFCWRSPDPPKEEDMVQNGRHEYLLPYTQILFYAFCWLSLDPPNEEDKVNKMATMRRVKHSALF